MMSPPIATTPSHYCLCDLASIRFETVISISTRNVVLLVANRQQVLYEVAGCELFRRATALAFALRIS